MCSCFITRAFVPNGYVTPYLQNADHMRFQISDANYPQHHNHVDVQLAGSLCAKQREELKALRGQLIRCSTPPITPSVSQQVQDHLGYSSIHIWTNVLCMQNFGRLALTYIATRYTNSSKYQVRDSV